MMAVIFVSKSCKVPPRGLGTDQQRKTHQLVHHTNGCLQEVPPLSRTSNNSLIIPNPLLLEQSYGTTSIFSVQRDSIIQTSTATR